MKFALLIVFNTFSCFLKLPPACLSWLFMSFCCSLTALNNCTTPLVAILVKVLSAFLCKGFGILLLSLGEHPHCLFGVLSHCQHLGHGVCPPCVS